MNLLKSYRSKQLSGDDNYRSGDSLDSSASKSANYNLDIDDMFGNAEVMKKSADPVRGKRYLFFTLIMIIVLSFHVIINTNSQSIKHMAEQNIKENSEPIVPVNKTNSSSEGSSATEESSSNTNSSSSTETITD